MLEATTLTLVGALFVAPVSAANPSGSGLILVHAAYGTPREFVVTGRVVEDKGVRVADPARGRFANAIDTIKAMKRDPIAGAVVEVEVQGCRYTGAADTEGDFEIHAAEACTSFPEGWLAIRAWLVDGHGRQAPEVEGRLLIIADAPGVGVISDFDDTVVESGVSDKAKLVYHTLTSNAAQLLPVAGVAEAYGAAESAGARAFFYVSGSPESLHERISEFLRLHEIPPGPILLKSFSTEALGEQQEYKRRRIDAIMDVFPKLRFVLVGDSGEKDPEVYRRAALEHPDRVLGIVIRRVQAGDNSAVRLAGMVVVDDYAGKSDVIATFVRRAAAQGGSHATSTP